MSDPAFLLVAIFSLGFSGLFFIADYFEQNHPKVHVSLIAGISSAYFFLLVLPEIAEGMPEYPLHLEILEYSFILVGFCFVHVTEKIILQKVEAKSQHHMRNLLRKERGLEVVEKNIEIVINSELQAEKLDEPTLRHLSMTLQNLKEEGEKIEDGIQKDKNKIQKHINKDLNELRFFTNFTYHFLVGIILVGLLFVALFQGVLFFIFAWFRAIISNRTEPHQVFSDLDIEERYEETPSKHLILSFSAFLGISFGLIYEFLFSLNLEMIFILFSFISGVILYTIVREIIPEKEKGRPLYFLAGVIGFTVFVLILNYFTAIVLL